jgi:hypothetical protein
VSEGGSVFVWGTRVGERVVRGLSIVARNAVFDHGFLQAELGRAGLRLESDFLCTMFLARRGSYPVCPAIGLARSWMPCKCTRPRRGSSTSRSPT